MILQESILEQTRDLLRDELSVIENPRRSIRITPDETVPAYSGTEFIGIYNAEYVNEFDHALEQRKDIYELTVGITRRTEGMPKDGIAEAIYTKDETLLDHAKNSLLERAWEIVRMLDGNWTLVKTVYDLFPQETFCIMSPLGLTDVSSVIKVGSEHFQVSTESDNPYGLVVELQFRGFTTYHSKI